MKSRFFDELAARQPELACCIPPLVRAAGLVAASIERGGKLLICGNGGSAADAQHIAGELCKGFLSRRRLSPRIKEKLMQASPQLDASMLDRLQWGLPAIPLTGSDSLFTAFANDVDAELVYAQQLIALGRPGDVLLAISTSGNARNVVAAAALARGMDIGVVALSGLGGGRLGTLADVKICVPAIETFRIQELHLPIYHSLCAALEEHFEAMEWGDRLQ